VGVVEAEVVTLSTYAYVMPTDDDVARACSTLLSRTPRGL
jgi:hypothetical protein